MARVHVWPNPAGDVLHVDGAAQQQVVITNLLGQAVYCKAAAGSHLVIDVSDMPNGLYVLRCGEWVVKWERR